MFARPENPSGYKNFELYDIDHAIFKDVSITSKSHRASRLRSVISLNEHMRDARYNMYHGPHSQACKKKVKGKISVFNKAVDDLAIANPHPCPKVSLRRARQTLTRRNYRAQVSAVETEKLRERNSSARRIARKNMDSDRKDEIRRKDKLRKRKAKYGMECEQEECEQDKMLEESRRKMVADIYLDTLI